MRRLAAAAALLCTVTVAGSLPSAGAGALATGPGTALEVEWSPEQAWDNDGSAIFEASVVVSGDGRTAVAAWIRQVSGIQEVYASTASIRDGRPTWSAPQALTAAGDSASSIGLAISADGTRAAVSFATYQTGCFGPGRTCIKPRMPLLYGVEVVTATIAAGAATWIPSMPVALVPSLVGSTSLAASRDLGRVTVAWTQLDSTNYELKAATGGWNGSGYDWSAPVDVGRGEFGYILTVATSDTGDRSIVTWRGTSSQAIRYAVGRDLATTPRWSAPATLSAPGTIANMPDVAMSGDGRTAAAIWMVDDPQREVAVSTATIGRSSVAWDRPTRLLVMDPQYGGDVTIAMSGAVALAAWSEEGPRPGIYASTTDTSTAGRPWSTPARISEKGIHARFPQIAVGRDGAMAFSSWTFWQPGSTESEAGTAVGTLDGTSMTWASTGTIGSTPATEGFPVAAMSGDGRVVATAYTSDEPVTGNAAAATVGRVGPDPGIVSVGVDGEPAVGQTLTARAATSGVPAPVAYQWQRRVDGVFADIRGARSAAYAVTPRDAGTRLRAVATVAGSSATATVRIPRLDQEAVGFDGLPRRLASPGRTVITRDWIRTTAGQRATVVVRPVGSSGARQGRGDISLDVRRGRHGYVAVVVPPGYAGRLRVTVSAPATLAYHPLRISRAYRVR